MDYGVNGSNNLDNVLVSIVVPVYNVKPFLAKCIDSLLAQTHPSLEIILVDDGSTDGSEHICDSYVSESNVVVIHKKNGGLSSARNAGIDIAHGDYIGFVDSDDFVAPAMFRTLLEAAVTRNVPVATCGRFITNEDGQVSGTGFSLPDEKVFKKIEAMTEILSNGAIDVAAWDKLYRRELFDEIRFPVGHINEDAAIIFHLLDGVDSLVHIGTPMYYYRKRHGSITKSGYKSNKIQALDHAEAIDLFLCNSSPSLKPYCKQYTAYICCQLLSLMLKDPEAKKRFPDHYHRYISVLRKDIWYLFTNKNVAPMWKLRGAMIWLNLYGILYKILK